MNIDTLALWMVSRNFSHSVMQQIIASHTYACAWIKHFSAFHLMGDLPFCSCFILLFNDIIHHIYLVWSHVKNKTAVHPGIEQMVTKYHLHSNVVILYMFSSVSR